MRNGNKTMTNKLYSDSFKCKAILITLTIHMYNNRSVHTDTEYIQIDPSSHSVTKIANTWVFDEYFWRKTVANSVRATHVIIL